MNIYSDFLFRVFLFKFKKFFQFPMTRFNPKTKREIKHAYFNWQNQDYQEFMIHILKALEPICFEANSFISNLDEDVEEVIFIEQGVYDIGFNLNHMKRFKLRFGAKTVVGAFNVCFDKHQMFIYKTVTQCSGYFVRKLRWKQIMEMFNEFDIIMKRKVLFEFIVRVIRPVKKFREDDLKKQPHLAEAQQASFKFEDVNFGKIEQIELEKAV